MEVNSSFTTPNLSSPGDTDFNTDIDVMSQIALELDGHSLTYSTTKLRESERKLTKFQAESEKCFKLILADFSSCHEKYLSRMVSLHQNLQKDVKDLAGIKSNISGFVLPSALAATEPKDNHMDEPMDKFQPKASVPYFQAGKESDRLEVSQEMPELAKGDQIAYKKSHKLLNAVTSSDGDALLTEKVFKDHLFSTLLPVIGIKETISESLIPLYEQVKNIAVHTHDIRYQSSNPLAFRDASGSDVEGAVNKRLPVQPSHEITLGASQLVNSLRQQDDRYESEESGQPAKTESSFALPKPKNVLRKGTSKLNFADDILGGNEIGSIDLLQIMHAYRMPGEGRNKAIFAAIGAEPERTSCLAKALNSSHFEKLIAVVIILNMVFMTYSSDYAVKNPFDQSTQTIRILEFSFQLFYTVELIIKVFVHRFYYFVAGEWHWNLLDSLLVATSSYDMCMALSGQTWEASDRGKSSFNLTFLRVLRLARFLKVIRVFRVVRFVHHLHSLLRVVASTIQPLFWCSILLLCFFYIFAILFVNAASAYLETDPELDPQQKDKILDYWGSVSTAMISLYKSSTGGIDWGEVGDVLYDMGKVYYALFLFFIAFIILALLNILTGIFVDSAMKVTAEDKDGEAVAKLAAERATVMDLAKLHCVLSGKSVEDNGTITGEQFEICMASPAMRARFSVMGLEIWDSKEFFQQLVALGDSDEVDLRTFVAGCMQMRGSAQRLGLQTLIGQVSHLTDIVKYGHRRQSRKISTMSKKAQAS